MEKKKKGKEPLGRLGAREEATRLYRKEMFSSRFWGSLRVAPPASSIFIPEVLSRRFSLLESEGTGFSPSIWASRGDGAAAKSSGDRHSVLLKKPASAAIPLPGRQIITATQKAVSSPAIPQRTPMPYLPQYLSAHIC